MNTYDDLHDDYSAQRQAIADKHSEIHARLTRELEANQAQWLAADNALEDQFSPLLADADLAECDCHGTGLVMQEVGGGADDVRVLCPHHLDVGAATLEGEEVKL